MQNVVVTNGGSDALGIEVQPEAVARPGFADERREATGALIVSPKRFSIDAGGQRTVRLLLREPPKDQEAVYRIKLLPQPKDFGAQGGAGQGEKRTMLRVITTVGLLVFAEPPLSRDAFSWKWEGGALVFRNEGNANVYLENGTACRAPEQGCEELPANRLYPGNSWTVHVPRGKLVVYTKRTPRGFENISIPPE
jgi:P pilus assembly chaperone PapD